jgi:hypothetical protein
MQSWLPEGENAMPAKPDPKKILDEAMQLEPTTRAFIAETLLESLDLDQDFAVSPEWLEEIRRRCVDIDSGKATLLDSAMVINELRGKYTR